MTIDYIIEKYGNTENLGLEEGRSGIALLCLLLSENSSFKKYRRYAINHISYIYDNIYSIKDVSYNNGLIGIACFLEYAYQVFHVDIYKNDLLQIIDDIVYKLSLFHTKAPLSLNDGIVGYLLFFYIRLNHRIKIHPYRILTLKECSIILIDRLIHRIYNENLDILSREDLYDCYNIVRLFKFLDITPQSEKIYYMIKQKIRDKNFISKLSCIHKEKSLILCECSMLIKNSRHHICISHFL